ncbi:MAG: hypothetical protein ACRDF4_04750 [Rhabdochlamydiaceae bacterium]
MEPTLPFNPAAVHLDQTEAELVLVAAGAGDNKEETLTQPAKVRQANGRIYREVQLQGKRQKKRTAWYWQHGILMDEEYKGTVNPEQKWVCQLCRGLQAYGSRSSGHINEHLRKDHKKRPPVDEDSDSTATMSQQSVLELQRHAP